MPKKKIFVLLTNPFQLVYAECILSKFKNIIKVGIVINPTINENSINTIKFNAKILGYKKILDLRNYGKQIENVEQIKLFEKLFNQKKLNLYLEKKIYLKSFLKNKINFKKGDLFILRKAYNIHEQIFYFTEVEKYFSINDGLDFLWGFVSKLGFINSLKVKSFNYISNILLRLKFLRNKKIFYENIKLNNIKFSNKFDTKFTNKKVFKLIAKIKSKSQNRFKECKIFIFGNPLIENRKLFNTNGRKDADIYNSIYYLAKKKYRLKKNEIILKIHPRVSYKNFNSIKKHLEFNTINFNDHTLSEIFLFSKKIKAIYTFGSSIGFYSRDLFGIKNYYVSIKNLNINENYAQNLEKKFNLNNFEIIKINDH